MSKSNAFENALLLHIFNNSAIAGVGDVTGLPASGTAGSLYVALHTADPGEAGDQTTSEATYTGYARVAVARSGAGWTVTGNAVENAADVLFPVCSAGSPQTVTHFSVGKSITGAGMILFKGAMDAPGVSVGPGVQPKCAAGSMDGTED